MGNSSTKEARPEGDSGRRHSTPGDPSVREYLNTRESGTASRRRMSRAEIFGIGAGPSRERQDAPFERRETKQEREARRLERERVARAKERERSMREEHVDGGYLVTLGTYTGTEDFSKPVVRQLQVFLIATAMITRMLTAVSSRLRESLRPFGKASTIGLPAGLNTS